jgi:hypothetical protein
LNTSSTRKNAILPAAELECAEQPTRCDKIQPKKDWKIFISFFLMSAKKFQLHSSLLRVHL